MSAEKDGSSRSRVTVEVHGLTRLMFQMAVVSWALVVVLVGIALLVEALT